MINIKFIHFSHTRKCEFRQCMFAYCLHFLIASLHFNVDKKFIYIVINEHKIGFQMMCNIYAFIHSFSFNKLSKVFAFFMFTHNKIKLLACFERLSSNRKIGFSIGSIAVVTFPLFYKVIVVTIFLKILQKLNKIFFIS